MRERALVDSGFLFGGIDEDDKHYDDISNFLARNTDIDLIVPEVALTETTLMIRRRKGWYEMQQFLGGFVSSGVPIVYVEPDDLRRAHEVMLTYPSRKLDFVDCCIVALAERMNITHICTIDHVDFRIVRPQHTPYFNLFPEQLSR